MASDPWPKYLRSVKIDGFRGWTGEEVRFEFPVCVLAGENGSGKSTVLQAAAVAYSHPRDKKKTFYPSTFFLDTAWEHISGATLTYRLRDGDKEKEYNIRRPTQRWRFPRTKAKRRVIWQDISRTLPLDATVGYATLAKRAAIEVSADLLDQRITNYFSSIMGRPYDEAKFAKADLDISKSVGVVKLSQIDYSQFHQGAGESTTLDLLRLLQKVPKTSLVLIDEVEASLHPRAQRRLVHFLLWLARIRHVQVIISTHSPYVLEELPHEGRVFLSRGTAGIDVHYGITPDYALSKMDDLDRPELYLFTEDEESTELITSILREYDVDLTRIKCIKVGPNNVVGVLASVANNRDFPITALGVLDAGSEYKHRSCIQLPGSEGPERQVFEDILTSAVKHLADRLEMSEQSMRDAMTDAISLTDHHDWLSTAARKLGQSREYLWATMCRVWSRHCLSESEANPIIEKIRSHLP